ncbi:MAG: hypothetical protein AAGJ35_02620 [Myxococcota bacterium]
MHIRYVFSCLSLVGCLSLWGCGYNITPFNVATTAMARPTIFLDARLAPQITTRIRWFERARTWAQSTILLHDVHRLLGPTFAPTRQPGCRKLKPCTPSAQNSCPPSCAQSLDVGEQMILGDNGEKIFAGIDERVGKALLPGWTAQALYGEIHFEAPVLGAFDPFSSVSTSEGYERWIRVREESSSTPGQINYLEISGELGYKTDLLERDFEYKRVDLVWVVNMLVKEGQLPGNLNDRSEDVRTERAETIKRVTAQRFEGVMGFVFVDRKGDPVAIRSSILLDEKSILYRDFKALTRGRYEVTLMDEGGSLQCRFDRLQGTCVSPDQSRRLSWP